jgi:hypothetical protein
LPLDAKTLAVLQVTWTTLMLSKLLHINAQTQEQAPGKCRSCRMSAANACYLFTATCASPPNWYDCGTKTSWTTNPISALRCRTYSRTVDSATATFGFSRRSRVHMRRVVWLSCDQWGTGDGVQRECGPHTTRRWPRAAGELSRVRSRLCRYRTSMPGQDRGRGDSGLPVVFSRSSSL